MTIESTVDSFIADIKPQALVLQGSWGRGKTHFWRARWEAYRSKTTAHRRHYAYVSLFGISSLEELKLAIYETTVVRDTTDLDFRITSRFSRWWQGVTKKGKAGLSIASKTGLTAGALGSIGKLYGALAFFGVRDMLVCLDDIERRGVSMRLLDVMGLVSLLWEQRNCSVAVIMNSGSLGEEDKKVWEENKEKVFQSELTFQPTADECISLIFPDADKDPTTRAAVQSLRDLKVTNIRIIERLKNALTQVRDVANGLVLSTRTWERVARSLTLIVYCHSGRGEDSPPLDRAKRFGFMSGYTAGNKSDERTEQEKGWDLILSSYGRYLETDLDGALIALATNGFPDPVDLCAALTEFDKAVEREKAKEGFYSVWKKYHNAVNDNRDEVLADFDAAFPNAAPYTSALDVDATIGLMKGIGADDRAERFMSQWISLRTGERASELDPRIVQEFGPIRDTAFLELLESTFRWNKRAPMISEVLLKLGKEQGFDPADIEVVAAATPMELAAILEATPGETTPKCIRFCLRLRAPENGPTWIRAGKNMEEALRLIARKSPYNAFRVKNLFAVSEEHAEEQ